MGWGSGHNFGDPCEKKINGELHNKLVGGRLRAQEAELASCFGRSVVHTALLHFMSLVINEQISFLCSLFSSGCIALPKES